MEAEPFERHVIRLDPDRVDFKIELTNHVFPHHSDSLRRVIEAAVKEIPVWPMAPEGG